MASNIVGEDKPSDDMSLGLQLSAKPQTATIKDVPDHIVIDPPPKPTGHQRPQNRQDSRALENISAPTTKGPRPWKIEDDSNFWRTYIDEAEDYDGDMVDGWNRALDNLLLFSGLFSAVNTAFIIETYKTLQPDPMESAVHLLQLILKHRNDSHQFTDQELRIGKVPPERSAIKINGVFFASLSCSLLVALGAVLAKDWLTQYDHRGLTSKPLSVQARTRQKKFEGLERWHFRFLMYFLPLLLQASLALFFIGLAMFLWEISSEVATVVLVFFSAGFMGYFSTWIMAIRHPSCPFQTPISRIIRRTGVYFADKIRNSSVVKTPRMRRIQFRVSNWTRRYRCKINRILTSVEAFLKTIIKSIIQTVEDRSAGTLAWELEKPRDPLNAECVGWLYEQAERREVIQQTLVVAPLLPPHHVLRAFNKRVGLFQRLATRYNFHVENLVGKQKRVLRPGDAIISGIALFHLLKATLKDPSKGGPKRILSEYRIRNIGDCELEAEKRGLPIYKVLSMVLYCVEILQPISDKFEIGWFTNFMEEAFKKDSDKLGSTIRVSDSVTCSVIYSELFLDAVIACCARRCVWPENSSHYYDRCDLQAVLDHFCIVLAGPTRPADQVISQVAIAMVAVQLSKVFDESIEEHKGLLERLLSAWYVVDKRKTVFDNIVLALDASRIIDPDQKIKDILFSFLEFLGDFLPRDMETSNKSEKWILWWPEAMKLFPGVLKLLQKMPDNSDEVPLETVEDVLNIFARLLPDDLQYEDIQESFVSTHSERDFPQLYTLSPSRHENPEDPFKWILRYFSKTKGAPTGIPVDGSQETQAPSTSITDSIVELLGWIVAYPHAKSSIRDRIREHPEYKAVPLFLFNVLEFKAKQWGTGNETEKENVVDEQKKARMICRHAVRHLSTLAHMRPPAGSVAMEVKLRVLLLVLQRWPTLSRVMQKWKDLPICSDMWPIDEQPLEHLKEEFQEIGSTWLSYVNPGHKKAPSDDITLVDNRVRVWAFQELMREWNKVPQGPGIVESPEQAFFLEEATIVEIIECLKIPASLPEFIPDSPMRDHLRRYFILVERHTTQERRREITAIRNNLNTHWLANFWGHLSRPRQWFHSPTLPRFNNQPDRSPVKSRFPQSPIPPTPVPTI